MNSLWLVLGLALAWRQEPGAPVPGLPTSAEREGDAAALSAEIRAALRAAPLPPEEDLRALRAETEALGPAGSEPLRELGRLGHALAQADRMAEARDLVAWVGEHAAALGDLAIQSWALDWLGQNSWVHDDLEDAAEQIGHAAEVDLLRHAPTEATRHFGDLASLRLIQGRFDEALTAATRAEEAARASGSALARRMAVVGRGGLLFELGRHQEVLALCLDAAPAPPGDAPHDDIQVRLDLLASDALADVGRLESALAFARRAGATAREPAVTRVAPLLHLEAELSLGLLLGDLGRLEEALAVLDGAAREFERLGDERGAAWAAKNRGFARVAAGRAAESLPDFEHAWKAGRVLGTPFLEGIGALGVAEALALGRPGGAVDRARVEEALAAAERVGTRTHDRTLEWRCAALRGHLALEDDAWELALTRLRPAIACVERWRRRLGASGLVEHALRQRSDPYRDAAFAAAHLGHWDEALGFASLLQARVLDALRVDPEGPPSPSGSAARDVLRERITRLELRLRDAETPEALVPELEAAEEQLDAELLAQELASGRTLNAPDDPLPLRSIGEALEHEGFDLALVYLVGPRETLVLEVGAGSEPSVSGRILALGEPALAAEIERLRAPIARLEAGAIDLVHLGFDARAARALGDALVRPLALADGARVALVLDRHLGTLPFELFVTGGEVDAVDFAHPFAHLAGLRFLGDEHLFVSYGSLARLARPVEPRGGPTLVFRAPEALGLARAADEVAGILRAFPEARVVSDARPADVAREAQGAARVHFLAHGRVDPERPAHAHLLLGGPEPGSSARLESGQAAELELDGAEVVLSACHSAEGEWRTGEGLAGLVRGFLLAGAREVLASQWAVDDRVTARFMELLYAELARGRDVPEALWNARRSLRGEEDPRGFSLAHPAFWAGWSISR